VSVAGGDAGRRESAPPTLFVGCANELKCAAPRHLPELGTIDAALTLSAWSTEPSDSGRVGSGIPAR